MANLTTRLGQFSDHFEFIIGQDETPRQQLSGRLGLIDGLSAGGDLGSPYTVPFDFCFDHQNLTFLPNQSGKTQLYTRLGLVDGLDGSGDLGSPYTVPFDFCFDHQNLVFLPNQPGRTQLYTRLGLVDELTEVSVTPSTSKPYIAISLSLGFAP